MSLLVNFLCPRCSDAQEDAYAGPIDHDKWMRRECPDGHVYWWMAPKNPVKGQRIVTRADDPGNENER